MSSSTSKKKFHVEVYETWVSTYEVEADTKSAAIAEYLEGNGSIVDNSNEFIGTDEQKSQPVMINGMPISVDSVRSVKEV